MVSREHKTRPPLLSSPILSREALLQKLETALVPSSTHSTTACRLVLLRAPAGYGKTTLLADFARRSRVPVLWYFLDHTDREFPRFLNTFTMLMCQAAPELAPALSPLLLQEIATAIQSGDQAQRKWVLAHYTTTLEHHLSLLSQPAILCLCDYHVMNQEEAHQLFLNELLRAMPSQLSLVIESRSVPILELSPLIARRQLLGIGSNLLGFSPQDVCDYARLQGISLPEDAAEQLAKTFDGWIAGLLLTTSLGVPSASSALMTDQHTLLAYLKTEVFADEAQAFTFLQDTALLPQLSALLCNALLQREDAAALLTHIEQHGLFLTRLPRPFGQDAPVVTSHASPTYVLHPTLRRVFADDIQRRHPERVALLHQRAAMFFQEQGDEEQAISHALAAQAYPLAVEIMGKAARPRSGELVPSVLPATFAQWFKSLPVAVREQSPRLLLQQATIAMTQQNYVQAAPLLEQAVQLVTHAPALLNEDPTLQAEILLARSALVFHEGHYVQAQQYCHDALQMLLVDYIEWRLPALVRLGICQSLLGEYAEGLSTLHQALHLSGHANITHQTALIHSSLANTYTLLSNHVLSEHHRGRAITLCERLHDTQGVINNRIWLAILHQNTGRFQQAETLLQQVLEQARAGNFPHSAAYTFFNLGANALDRDDLPHALEALEEGLHLARQVGDQRLVNQCLCELAMAYLLLQDVTTARVLLVQTTVATAGYPDNSGNTDQAGYEALGLELVSCTVLLYQRDFVHAIKRLRAFEAWAERAQLKRPLIEGLIRLAVCCYHLNQQDEMETAMTKVVQLVDQGYFEHIPMIELRRFPDFWQTVQQLPHTACLDAWRADLSQELLGEQKEEEGLEQVTLFVQEQVCVSPSPPARVQIRAFGEPSVSVDGVPITRWHMAKAMELCFFLLDYQHPIRKEQMVEALWSEDEEYVDQTVRSATHYLRKALGKDCLNSQGGVYTLDLRKVYGETIWYDVARFHHHRAQTQQALEGEDETQAENHLQAMIELYRGDYVQSFYSNWCIPRRDALCTQCLDAFRELAHLVWRQERWEESLMYWQRLVAHDPCDEEAHEGIMRCYLRLGKRNLAAQQYQRCREILQRELSLAPGSGLQKLYQRLTSHP